MILEGMTRYCNKHGNETIASTEDVKYYIDEGWFVEEHNPDVQGMQLAHHMDSELESTNHHSFVGMYERLYAIFVEKAGTVIANAILDAVAQKGYIP